ncbi:MAG: polyprenol monophosphomannose synthase [Fibrobacteres bacterium]|nr:polyprenol monophosphomannose synthase [Fibrobacterota bacterium]
MNEKALIVLPTYNEKENIEEITAAILKQIPELNILIADDNSPDGTGAIADSLAAKDKRIFVLHREKKEGLGRAYLAGFKWGLDRGYDLLFEMDADFSHDPKYLPKMIEASKNADLVIGSRYVQGVNVVNWPMSRLLLSWCGNQYVRLIIGLPVADATAGFKCFRRTTLEKLDFSKIGSSGYSFQIEVNFHCWKKGLRIKEIPIVFTDREKGTSKMSTGIVKEALLLLWKLKITSIFRK